MRIAGVGRLNELWGVHCYADRRFEYSDYDEDENVVSLVRRNLTLAVHETSSFSDHRFV